MNLVAKEFVSARDDERGVLILSQFAGAARGLTAALMVNPYATDDAAHALALALNMPARGTVERMRAMRSVVAQFNTYRWAADMLADAARVHPHRTRPRHDIRTSREPGGAARVNTENIVEPISSFLTELSLPEADEERNPDAKLQPLCSSRVMPP